MILIHVISKLRSWPFLKFGGISSKLTHLRFPKDQREGGLIRLLSLCLRDRGKTSNEFDILSESMFLGSNSEQTVINEPIKNILLGH